MPSFVYLAIGVVVLGVLLLVTVWNFYKTPRADEALIITGWRTAKGESPFKIHVGSGSVVIPILQRAQYLSLESRVAILGVSGIWDVQKIPVGVNGSVAYKVGNDLASITNAAARFLDIQQSRGVDESKMEHIIREVIHGHLRSIVGGMKIEDLISNRGTLAAQARDTSAQEMARMGIEIDSLQIQQIDDPSGFVLALSEQRNAEAQAEARKAKANRDREATEAEQEAQRLILEAQKKTLVARANNEAEQESAHERAAQAGPLARAEAMQAVVLKDTERARLEADLAQQRLMTERQRPAEAEATAIKTTAEGAAQATVAKARADSEATKLQGEAEAARRRAVGLAEADAVKAKALAEAEGLERRAAALREQSEAVVAQQVAEQLPEVVRAAASAYSNVDNLTILDGVDGVNNGMLSVLASIGPLLDAARSMTGRGQHSHESIDEPIREPSLH